MLYVENLDNKNKKLKLNIEYVFQCLIQNNNFLEEKSGG